VATSDEEAFAVKLLSLLEPLPREATPAHKSLDAHRLIMIGATLMLEKLR
jgi:hypothetical protein